MDSEISDYDEDVILPNSPLSQYLNDCETLEKKDFIEYGDILIKDNNDQSEKTFNIYDRLSYCMHVVLDIAKLYFNYIYSIFVPSLIPFEFSELKSVLRSAKYNKVLLPEDLSVLLNYEGDEDFTGELRLSYATVFQQLFQLLGFILIYLILKSSTAINIIKDSDLIHQFSDNFYFLCVLLETLLWFVSKAFFINIFVIVGLIFINITELFLCKALCYSIKKELQTTENIIVAIKKCTRLIQEAELIARGFTYASVPGIVERLELSTGLPITLPQRQYPELRKHVFMWNKEIFMLYRKNTQKLIKNEMIGVAVDISSQAMAVLDLKEFGDLLRCNIDSDADVQELLKFTDNLSVSSLKTMYLLAELQISEFYKYLYLIISFLVADDDLFHFIKRIKDFHYLNSAIKCLHSKQSDILKVACKMYKYYRSIEMLSDVEDKSVISAKCDSSALEINVHNMSLHLKAALKRLTDLEELFEKGRNLDESSREKLLRKVDDMSKQIKSEIDAYNEYYQKCNGEIQGILYGSKECPPNSSLSEEMLKAHEAIKMAVIPRCDIEPDIEDEIFEAVANKSSLDNDDHFEVFPVDEKKNIEVAGRLLRELKNVLIVKADEHRLREEKALAKKFNKEELPSDSCSSDDTSDEVKNFDEIELRESNAKEPNISRSLLDAKISQNSLECIYEEESGDFNNTVSFNIVPSANSSFATSIAALALQRQKLMGISNDACFSDGNSSSDDEDDT